MKQDKVFIEKYSFPSFLVIISISIIFRLCHAGQKKIYHIDELISFQCVNTTFGDKGGWLGESFICIIPLIEVAQLKECLRG